MSEYFITYHGGNEPASPEEGSAHKAKFGAWVMGLGDAVVNPGTPLGQTMTLSSNGEASEGGSSTMSGFSIVKADSMDAAVEIAKACPFLDMGGTLEVSELMEM